MSKKKSAKRPPLGIDEQLRQSLLASEYSRGEIAQATNVDEPMLSRFLSEKEESRRDLRLATAARLATFLGLELRPIRSR